MPNFTNFDFLDVVGVKKFWGFLAFSFQSLDFLETAGTNYQTGVIDFLNTLLKSVIRLFQTVLGVFSQKLSGNP